MRILGINCMNHDAAMAVVDGHDILWAAHAERYSRIKNDQFLINRESVNKCCWNVVFSSLGDLGIVQGHLAFVGAKKY